MKLCVNKLLEKWLLEPGNSEKKLAEDLGYNSVSAVYNWRYRGVPKYLERVLIDYLRDNITIDNFWENLDEF